MFNNIINTDLCYSHSILYDTTFERVYFKCLVALGSSQSAKKKRVNWFRDFYLAKHEKRHVELRNLDEDIFKFVQHNRALLFRDLLNGVNLMSEALTNVTSTLYGVREILLFFHYYCTLSCIF